ncbi:hypothetical protein KC851_02020 [Candidatus Kaiserbacteria bacterium]|nr:hypothetical protein [Candidatus Kaiserbacteria bacterium]
MKHTGKTGKRAGPVGYRTSSRYLHKKSTENARLRSRIKKENTKGRTD